MESFILGQNNFLLFIVIFTVSLGLAVSTYQSYRRTPLVYANVVMFLLCAMRACLEFGLQLTDSYDIVHLINRYNSIVAHLFYVLTWYIIYFYIRPFQKFKYSKTLDYLVAVGLLAIPNLFILYCFYTFQCSDFSTERIAGYWMYKFFPSTCTSFYQFYAFIVMIGCYTSLLMVYSIIKNAGNRTKQIALLVAFYLITWAVLNKLFAYSSGDWSVINHVIPMVLDGIIITWFVSGYRLVRDQFVDASSDILDSISDLSIQTDKDLGIGLTNNKVGQFFSEIEGRLIDFLAAHSRLHRNEMKSAIDSIMAGEKSSHEMLLMDKDGVERTFQIKVSERRWRGKVDGFTFLLSDMSEIKEKEKELAELNSTKDQIFSMIAHDLRKPALAFKGVTNKVNYLIQKKEFDRLKTLGNSIEKSAIQLNSLLDNLLKWALSQKNAVTVSEQPVDLKYITDELIKTFELITSEKGIIIDNTRVDPNLILHTDPDIMQTILRNLVDNAIKYSHSDSRVMLSTEVNADRIAISVKDQGIGMTSPQLTGLFSLDKAKSTVGTFGEKGSGLGLNLVLDLVDKTGGELTCNSAPGLGTEMSIAYPVE